MTESELLSILTRHNQAALCDYVLTLSPPQRQALAQSGDGLDFETVFHLFDECRKEGSDGVAGPSLSVPPIIPLATTQTEIETRKKAQVLGESLLAEGKVAVLVVAGGQGSRLGFEGPKGMFPCSPVRKKTLYQLLTEYTRALTRRFGAAIPLLFMTSPENHNDTVSFFEANHFFGYDPRMIHFFPQGLLPTLSPDGLLLLKNETTFCTNPDGHGGSLKAIHRSGLLEKLVDQGYTTLFYCQIDNPLVRMADPVFLGYHLLKQADVSTKVVRRRDLSEKVGIYASSEGKDLIVEYSDQTSERLSAIDEKGDILFWGGNTAIHVFTLDFIVQLNSKGFSLPFHRAVKNVDIFDPVGGFMTVQAWKFETFVFDAIPLAQRTACIEVARHEEFSPIKNSEGTDSLETACADMSALYSSWVRQAGISIPPNTVVEIDPLFAGSPEELRERISPDLVAHGRQLYISLRKDVA